MLFIGQFGYCIQRIADTGIMGIRKPHLKRKLIDIGLCTAFKEYWKLFMDGNLGHWIV